MSDQPRDTAMSAPRVSNDSSPVRTRRLYRPARPLPYELRQHTIAFVEEELYSQALSFLLNLLIAGVDNNVHDHSLLLPAYVPQAQIVALAATLVVHPFTTNRLSSPDQGQAADDALFYLCHLNALVGPVNAGFSSAFQFVSPSSSRHNRRRETTAGDGSPESGTGQGIVNISLANQSAVWNRVDDFWRVVGWAFNCSIRHSKRWDRWKLWLTFMLDVLESDLEACLAGDKAGPEEGDFDAGATVVASSMLARYLAQAGEGRAGKRRVMRAILADGSKTSLAEFGEIWKNETQDRKLPKDEHMPKRKRLNLEDGDFGDYEEVDKQDQDTVSESTPSNKRPSRKKVYSRTPGSEDDHATNDESPSVDFGGIDSVILRQRFVVLLVKLCSNCEQAFLETEDLLDMFTEFLRPLPLSVFTQFVLPTNAYLEPDYQASLNQALLQPLISAHAPTYNAETMRQAEFEQYFLPYPANHSSYVENARVSVLVEGLLRLLAQHLDLQATLSLRTGLREGIKARDEKAESGVRRKGTEEEEEAAVILRQSAARMLIIVDAAAASD